MRFYVCPQEIRHALPGLDFISQVQPPRFKLTKYLLLGKFINSQKPEARYVDFFPQHDCQALEVRKDADDVPRMCS